MRAIQHPGDLGGARRRHPWDVARSDPTHRYYDFKAEPHLIRTALEDFVPLAHWKAVETFYELLEWLNGSASPFESNDCATRPAHQNRNSTFKKKLRHFARLMILYRDLNLNVQPGCVQWLADATRHHLAQIDPGFRLGVVGTTIVPVVYKTLPGKPDGDQVMLTFWSWSDTEAEAMDNFGRTIANTRAALEAVAREIAQSSAAPRSS